MAHIFISYRSIAQEFALKLARDLLQAGYPDWVDRPGGIVPGDGVRRELEQGVNDAAAFLACLSGNYVESKWCLRELDRADDMDKPIIPVLIGFNVARYCRSARRGNDDPGYRGHLGFRLSRLL